MKASRYDKSVAVQVCRGKRCKCRLFIDSETQTIQRQQHELWRIIIWTRYTWGKQTESVLYNRDLSTGAQCSQERTGDRLL